MYSLSNWNSCGVLRNGWLSQVFTWPVKGTKATERML